MRRIVLACLVLIAACAAEGKAPPPKRPDFSEPRLERSDGGGERPMAALEIYQIDSGGVALLTSGAYALVRQGASAYLASGATAIIFSGATVIAPEGATLIPAADGRGVTVGRRARSRSD